MPQYVAAKRVDRVHAHKAVQLRGSDLSLIMSLAFRQLAPLGRGLVALAHELLYRHVRHDVDSDLKTWFASAILPHHAALTRYLRHMCRSSSEVPDLLQEALLRVYESATKSRPQFPKTFLFTTARNLLIDKRRRELVISIDHFQNTVSLDLPRDELSPERRLAALQDLHQLTRALESLPEKTRSVIWLRRVAGMSQRETASILGIKEGALEGHMTRGMRSLAKAVVVNGRVPSSSSPKEVPDSKL